MSSKLPKGIIGWGSGGPGRAQIIAPLLESEMGLSAGTASVYPPRARYSVSSGAPITPESVLELVRQELGIVKNPITKCQHCGQWGAVFCACPKCGAPIDPSPEG